MRAFPYFKKGNLKKKNTGKINDTEILKKKQMNVSVHMCGSLVPVIRKWDFEDQVPKTEGGNWK